MASVYRSRRRAGSPTRARPAVRDRPATLARPAAQERTGSRAQRQAARRQEIRRRRERVLLIGSLVVSAMVTAAWFPASALYHQHQQLASTTTRLAQVRNTDAALRQEERRLGSPSEVGRIAREQYQLVEPGQQVYEVLPASNGAGGSYDGDPGLQGPVRPSAASELPPSSTPLSGGTGGQGGAPRSGKRSSTHGGASTSAHGAASPPAAPTSLLGRIANTLEFWR